MPSHESEQSSSKQGASEAKRDALASEYFHEEAHTTEEARHLFWRELASDIQKELDALPVEEESPDVVAKRTAKLRAAYVVVRCNELLQERPELAPAWSAISAFCQSAAPRDSDLEFFDACFGAVMVKDHAQIPSLLHGIFVRYDHIHLANTMALHK